MKRKTFLSLVSMAVVCAMILMSCSELSAYLDNPVGSYVQFDKAELTIGLGNVVQNAATTISTEKITYTSSDESVVTVDENGTITAVGGGEAIITASVPANKYYAAGSATCLVRVDIPLTLEVLSEGDKTIVVKWPATGMKYSKNGAAPVNIGDESSVTIQVVKGDKVAFYGTAASYFPTKISGGTADVKVYGNIMSLVDETSFFTATKLTKVNTFSNLFDGNTGLKDASGLLLPATELAASCYSTMFSNCTALTTAPELPAKRLANSCYYSMFNNCTALTTAPDLPATTLANDCYMDMFNNCSALTAAPKELPATELASHCYHAMFNGCTALTAAPELKGTALAEYCYASMFQNCTGLITAPELPAETLAEYCYAGMFFNCTSLPTAPVLKATTLANYCYSDMFFNCTSLTATPVLSAPTLVEGCYSYMFNGCTSLNTVTCLATDISAAECTTRWLDGVAATGTFTRAGTTDWPAGIDGKPTGWNYSE